MSIATVLRGKTAEQIKATGLENCVVVFENSHLIEVHETDGDGIFLVKKSVVTNVSRKITYPSGAWIEIDYQNEQYTVSREHGVGAILEEMAQMILAGFEGCKKFVDLVAKVGIDLNKFENEFLPNSISDRLGSSLDGKTARLYLESIGIPCVDNKDFGRYGAAITATGFKVANNGFVSRALSNEANA